MERLLMALGLLAGALLVIGGFFIRGGGIAPSRWPWLGKLLLWVGGLLTLGLAVTGYIDPVIEGEPTHGWPLLLHSTLGGALLVLMPLVALVCAQRLGTHHCPSLMVRFCFWLTGLLGIVLSVTILTSMIPFFTSVQLHETIALHRWAGVLFVLTIGAWFVSQRLANRA